MTCPYGHGKTPIAQFHCTKIEIRSLSLSTTVVSFRLPYCLSAPIKWLRGVENEVVELFVTTCESIWLNFYITMKWWRSSFFGSSFHIRIDKMLIVWVIPSLLDILLMIFINLMASNDGFNHFVVTMKIDEDRKISDHHFHILFSKTLNGMEYHHIMRHFIVVYNNIKDSNDGELKFILILMVVTSTTTTFYPNVVDTQIIHYDCKIQSDVITWYSPFPASYWKQENGGHCWCIHGRSSQPDSEWWYQMSHQLLQWSDCLWCTLLLCNDLYFCIKY